MRVALAAYRLMEQVAESHGGVGSAQAAVLASYQRALGIDTPPS